MFEKTQIRPRKTRLMVQFCLNTGEGVEGQVFVGREERLIDLLNDERSFVPVDLGDGRMKMVSKSSIAAVNTLEEIPEDQDDPYAVLKIQRTADDAEVRQAWMARVKACHPDRLAALNLDLEIIVAARKVSQRINASYDQIMRERRAARKGAA